jgi:hypothetical protein
VILDTKKGTSSAGFTPGLKWESGYKFKADDSLKSFCFHAEESAHRLSEEISFEVRKEWGVCNLIMNLRMVQFSGAVTFPNFRRLQGKHPAVLSPLGFLSRGIGLFQVEEILFACALLSRGNSNPINHSQLTNTQGEMQKEREIS